MGNSIEGRLPFMDYELAELAMALPVRYKLRSGFGKWILRRISHGRVPEEVRWARRKFGFSTDQSSWIPAGLGRSIRDKLAERKGPLKRSYGLEVSLDDYSDSYMVRNQSAVSEALALVWLGDRAR